ncbi:restriction endonuclease subunit S [Citrobacter braakii]|uniref:restriction endonuclease subunit S n=1 Tax=Citrobacter braakii TaxID=57706 RepID=UPI0021BBFE7E|nr:restriction endonuclease subunit S [Citrobacter braakii]MDU5157334.1 restriction endonuclease subunit S [Citrobacter sp.]WFW71156.1 restriction endonuclease subunit S [Citrobacter braakii]
MVPKLRFTSFKDTWSSAYLSQLIVSLDAGVSVNSIDELPDDNEYSILKTSCVSFGYFDERERKKVVKDEISRLKEILLSNSILISRMNTPALVGANAYIKDAPKNTFVPDRLWQVKVNDNICNIKWLASFLSSDKGRYLLKEQASGTSNSMKNITKKDVFQIMLAFPCKEEQTIIADFLSSVDEKITLLNKQYDLLCQYKKGIMQKIFSQEVRFKDEYGEEFPEWEESLLSERIKVQGGFAFKSQLFSEMASTKVLRIGDISEEIDLSAFSGVFSTETPAIRYQVNKGDFVMALSGATFGKMGLIKCESAFLNQRVATFRLLDNTTDILSFYYYYMSTMEFINYIKSIPTASAQPNISNKDIELYLSFIPTKKEQTKIANFLSALDNKIAVKKAELDKLKTWKQGLLQQMFV